MSSDLALRVSNLSKCYFIYNRPQDRLLQSLWRGKKRFYREFWALRDVTFEVAKGTTVGIIGRNGSGKSTLLQMIAGTLNPTAGAIEVHGKIAALLELGSGFNPEFTGRENVYLNGAILGFSRKEMERLFDQIAAFAGIGDFIDQPVKTYSSGMMVRLAFSVSVCVEPDILIVDEALAVGDAAFQFKCLERLEHLVRSGTTLLFVSHDIGMVKAFCQHAIYLVDGKIKSEGSPDEIAELYLLDMRNEQRQAMTEEHAPETGSASHAGPFPGVGQGKILRAEFSDTHNTSSCYTNGDEIQVVVTAQFDGSVKNPCVSIIIKDRRMIQIGGQLCRVTNAVLKDGLFHATVRYTFKAAFSKGHYFITTKLSDYVKDSMLLPIDKQPGQLAFSVVQTKQSDFLGLVDLEIKCHELDTDLLRL